MLQDMTQEKWDRLSGSERDKLRQVPDSPLAPYKGWRVEVERLDGERDRFIVGMSTGWRPCYLEVKTRRSFGGFPADREYRSVRPLYRVR